MSLEDQAAAAPPSLSLPKSAVQHRLFPFALWIPGILHIVSNAEAEVLNSMTGFEAWQKSTRKINIFLAQAMRLLPTACLLKGVMVCRLVCEG